MKAPRHSRSAEFCASPLNSADSRCIPPGQRCSGRRTGQPQGLPLLHALLRTGQPQGLPLHLPPADPAARPPRQRPTAFRLQELRVHLCVPGVGAALRRNFTLLITQHQSTRMKTKLGGCAVAGRAAASRRPSAVRAERNGVVDIVIRCSGRSGLPQGLDRHVPQTFLYRAGNTERSVRPQPRQQRRGLWPALELERLL